jgi:hypothetical protein
MDQTYQEKLMKNMNLFEIAVNIQGFILFAQFFLHVNQHNPVRHLFLSMYAYLFYLYLKQPPLPMYEHCPISYMEQRNYTHGEFM